jgi:hypothetical protein
MDKETAALPLRHISIRVPWHDDGWRGTVCTKPEQKFLLPEAEPHFRPPGGSQEGPMRACTRSQYLRA